MKKYFIILSLMLAAVTGGSANSAGNSTTTVALSDGKGAPSSFTFNTPEGKVSVNDFTISRAGTLTTVALRYDLAQLALRSNRFVALQPMLVSENKDTVLFRPIVVAGRKQYVVYQREGEVTPAYANATVYRLAEAQRETVPYTASVPYKEWMETATLHFNTDLCGCCDLDSNSIAGPFLTLKPKRNPVEYMRYAIPALSTNVKELTLRGSAFINFVVNKTDLRPDYMDNRKEIKKITDTLDIMVADKNVTVKEIQIHGFASPESPYTHNRNLAIGRAQALTDYVRSLYNLPANVFAPAQATPENWQGLRDAVAKGGYEHRTQLLGLIDRALADIGTNGGRGCDAIEQQMKRIYNKEYTFLLKHIYPRLRRSDYRVTFIVRRFAADEAKDIMRSKPSYLSADELATLVALYPVGSQDYNNVFAVARRNIAELKDTTNIRRSNTIMAMAALKRGDTTTARPFLDSAGDTPEADNARGAYYIILGRYDIARPLLRRAANAGIAEAKENLRFMGLP